VVTDRLGHRGTAIELVAAAAANELAVTLDAVPTRFRRSPTRVARRPLGSVVRSVTLISQSGQALAAVALLAAWSG
jgi:hypothetical protein